ncbi:hypothetical protein TNIN_48701, partial [Trichonephila inaurata madagascariensis]
FQKGKGLSWVNTSLN